MSGNPKLGNLVFIAVFLLIGDAALEIASKVGSWFVVATAATLLLLLWLAPVWVDNSDTQSFRYGLGFGGVLLAGVAAVMGLWALVSR